MMPQKMRGHGGSVRRPEHREWFCVMRGAVSLRTRRFEDVYAARSSTDFKMRVAAYSYKK